MNTISYHSLSNTLFILIKIGIKAITKKELKMKIASLAISNFRGIKDVILENLGSMVIIAGQNGSGKSCIFDAIRLLKSVYGG